MPAFTDSRNLRLFLGTLLYLAQGFPQGVVFYAIPGWLAVNGQSAAVVGSAAAAASLPWAAKWLAGGMMDRYTFVPMGRRRPWLVGAQLCITLLFLAYAIASPLPSEATLVIGFTFALSSLTAIQDVALDALVIDLTPESEKGRLNGFMFGGKLFGIAFGTAVTGYFIQYHSISAAMLVMMALFAIPAMASIAIRERPGERLLPWTNGIASHAAIEAKQEAWWPLLRLAFTTLFRRDTLLVIGLLLLFGVGQTLYEKGGALFAARVLGWGESDSGNLIGISNLMLGAYSLLIGGPLIDRYGPRPMALFGGVGAFLLLSGFAFAEPYWSNDSLFIAFAISSSFCTTSFYLSFLVLAMRVSAREVAATSFALLVAAQALGSSLGGGILGPIEQWGGFKATLGAAGVLFLCASLLTLAMGRKTAGVYTETEETESILTTD